MEIFSTLIVAGGICVCIMLSLYGLMKLDKDHGMVFSGREWLMLFAGSVISAGVWNATTATAGTGVRWAWLVVHIYFLICSMTDLVTCQVYDLLQYPGIGAAAYLLLRSHADIMVGISILLFAGLQYVIFMRFYGEADGMAFLVAAVAAGSRGCEIDMYLCHMIAAYLLLGIVQAVRGNIGNRGNLKRAVPFLPYIAVSFWMILL